jgi:type II secretory pathway pseudopilin PulG
MVNRLRDNHGYTYLGLLLAILLFGTSLAGAGTIWSAERQRERERELLHIGDKFRTAIGQYYNRTPGAIKQFPPNLEALLRDERFPVPRRYLREIYADPFTGARNWGIVEAPSGGIMGIYSLSSQRTFKRANFHERDAYLKDKTYTGEWMFVYIPEERM